MAQPKRWLDEIIETFQSLGGHAHYYDLYEAIENRNLMNFQNNPTWRATVRKAIETHSSDSKIYDGKNNIFYSVEGINKGHWGLIDFTPDINNVDLTEDDAGFPEGKISLRKHVYRERNQKVIKLAKESYKKKYGILKCEACGFVFEDMYGEIAKDFIEAHHIIPLAELQKEQITKAEDIVLLCSNCHRMIHRIRPWITRGELCRLFLK